MPDLLDKNFDYLFDSIQKPVGGLPTLLCPRCGVPSKRSKESRNAVIETREGFCVACHKMNLAQRVRERRDITLGLRKVAAQRQSEERARDRETARELRRQRSRLINLLKTSGARYLKKKAKADKTAAWAEKCKLHEEWYASDPLRVCKVCLVEKPLSKFKVKGGRYQGHICRTCDRKRYRQRQAIKRLSKPKKLPLSEAEKLLRRLARKRDERARIMADPILRLDRNISEQIRGHLRKLKCGKPVGGWKSSVGYSLHDLKVHLENKFTEGMSWDNYGAWHVDHIMPRWVFSAYSAAEEYLECWALDNLQPLWAEDNVRKGGSLIWEK